jgi:hypothetical protein
MKLNIETTTKIVAEHKAGLLAKLGQGMSLGQLVTMSLRDIISSQLNGGHEQKRGKHGLA